MSSTRPPRILIRSRAPDSLISVTSLSQMDAAFFLLVAHQKYGSLVNCCHKSSSRRCRAKERINGLACWHHKKLMRRDEKKGSRLMGKNHQQTIKWTLIFIYFFWWSFKCVLDFWNQQRKLIHLICNKKKL